MIAPGADLKIYVATRPVDFRRGLDGLAAAVQEMHGLDLQWRGVCVPRQTRTARFIVRPFVRFPVGELFYRIDNQCSFSAGVQSRAAQLCVLFPSSARRQEPTIASP